MRVIQAISKAHLAGGAEKSVLALKQELTKRGDEVMVVAAASEPGVETFSDFTFPPVARPGAGVVTRTVRRIWNPEAYRLLHQVVRDFRPDVIHCHTMTDLTPATLIGGRPVPTVVTVHGPEVFTRGLLQWYLPAEFYRDRRISLSNLTLKGAAHVAIDLGVARPAYRAAMRRSVAALVAPSRYMLGILEREGLGVPLRQIYNGIALPDYCPPRATGRVLYVGRLEHFKGVEVLVAAFAAVHRQLPHTSLHIVGDGPQTPDLRQQAEAAGIADAITFTGWLDQEAVLEAYRDADVLAVPSTWPENLPTVCIEALAVGRPIVATNTGGIRELVTERTGRIVRPGDANALSAALVELLSLDSLDAISRAARASATGFSTDAFLTAIRALYAEVASS